MHWSREKWLQGLVWSREKQWRLILLVPGLSLAIVLTLYNFEWTGFGQGESVSTTTSKRDTDGNIVETTTTQTDPRKNLWDWLGLLGVPLTLGALGAVLQQQERSRAANEAKEEILQVYFDRLSTLLVDKNILAIAAKVHPLPEKQGTDQPEITITLEERELLDSAVDVVRARTLSILRRFEKDSERKTSVIRFLLEAEVIGKAKLPLSGADLSNANLSEANLSEANLFRAILSCANLSFADLSNANLSNANLFRAILSFADLFRANLSEANLSRADLSEADLSEADLSEADLSNIKWGDLTQWPGPTEVAKAKNIPNALKQQLGITDTPPPSDHGPSAWLPPGGLL